ncbi:hypothetical protein Anas_13372, partial [Armadillidium nasatum]
MHERNINCNKIEVIVTDVKRSPNVGKFEALKRHELVDKKISEGILETVIDPNTPGVVRVHPGGKAFLLCRVENLGTNSVMWFIGDKVLSIDTSIFVPDKRLFLSYDSETGTWILEINKVQMRDQGNYSCQVSNKPTIRHTVSLQVIPNGKPLLPTLKKKRRRRKKNIRRGIHEDKQNLVIEELQQNLSSIWVQLNELKVNLETHIKETIINMDIKKVNITEIIIMIITSMAITMKVIIILLMHKKEEVMK